MNAFYIHVSFNFFAQHLAHWEKCTVSVSVLEAISWTTWKTTPNPFAQMMTVKSKWMNHKLKVKIRKEAHCNSNQFEFSMRYQSAVTRYYIRYCQGEHHLDLPRFFSLASSVTLLIQCITALSRSLWSVRFVRVTLTRHIRPYCALILTNLFRKICILEIKEFN